MDTGFKTRIDYSIIKFKRKRNRRCLAVLFMYKKLIGNKMQRTNFLFDIFATKFLLKNI